MAYFPTVTCMLQIARIVLQIHRSQLPFRFYYYYYISHKQTSRP